MNDNVNSGELSLEELDKVSSYNEQVSREVIIDKTLETGDKVFREKQLDELRKERELLRQSKESEIEQDKMHSNYSGRSR